MVIPVSTVALPFYILNNRMQGFQFPHILANTCYFLFAVSHPDVCEVNRIVFLIRCLERLMQSKRSVHICPALERVGSEEAAHYCPLHSPSLALPCVRGEQHINLIFSLEFIAFYHVI